METCVDFPGIKEFIFVGSDQIVFSHWLGLGSGLGDDGLVFFRLRLV